MHVQHLMCHLHNYPDGIVCAASRKPVGAADRAAADWYRKLAAILPAGRRRIVSGDGCIAAISCRDIVQRISGLFWSIWQCGKLHGSNGHGYGKARDTWWFYPPGNVTSIFWSFWMFMLNSHKPGLGHSLWALELFHRVSLWCRAQEKFIPGLSKWIFHRLKERTFHLWPHVSFQSLEFLRSLLSNWCLTISECSYSS